MEQFNFFSHCRLYIVLMLTFYCQQMTSLAQKLIVYPCTDFQAIRWVRDSTFCNQYYICHFGQPLSMPACPSGQVWSNIALNCVPQHSRWDDCVSKPRLTKAANNNTYRTTTSTVTRQPAYASPSIVPRNENSVIITVNNLPEKLNPSKSKKVPDHECFRSPGAFLPHPDNCHWYFNCSFANLEALGGNTEQLDLFSMTPGSSSSGEKDGFIPLKPFRVAEAGAFVWECRFPQLFDEMTGRCREFVNVDCKSRFEAVDQCEYSVRRCRGERCAPCHHRFGRCRGRPDGVYPLHQDGWAPSFVTCYRQRNIAIDECVPKTQGGFLPDCVTRPDGYYPDEQGRCGIFFRCALGIFRGYDECPPGTVFDPAIPACQSYSLASSPCGESHNVQCGGKLDGYYADPYGRCTNYFQCQHGVFQQYLSCDLGIFDPLTQKCCGLPEYAPPPCAMSTMCVGQPDGRYPATTRGCSFFYECFHGDFLGLRRCTESDGGIFFNPDTGTCDYPQNICPPCGYKWWGWIIAYSTVHEQITFKTCP
ncbi:unnamed protein product [Candidula unifasciata]|uniref:Chitin-binding type-2 domain-containing protein n=1 Tax=Candidula unifasciata TaxID=100452 RepID=A0A8S3Z3T2_9EUPU|nr:unnamed protein product [Candidula unifasciata]